MKIELIHPIEHDQTLYGRGVHDLTEEQAKLFLEVAPWAARMFEVLAAPPQGTVEPVVPRSAGNSKTRISNPE